MLLHTFRHIKGIGPSRERRLWTAGCKSWADLLSGDFDVRRTGISPGQFERIAEEIQADMDAFESGNLSYLAKRMKATEHWRFFRHFHEKAVFLDIETTGMDAASSIVTVIGLHSERDGPMVFIDGANLHKFEEAISNYDIVVTFNGATFDLPFLRRTFPDVRLPPAHIDCRWLARHIGLKGGLKQVERTLGIDRNPDVADMSGAEAVTLWQRYVRQDDPEALQLLVRYNLEDTINLHALLVHCLSHIYGKHLFLGIEESLLVPPSAFFLDVDGLIRNAIPEE